MLAADERQAVAREGGGLTILNLAHSGLQVIQRQVRHRISKAVEIHLKCDWLPGPRVLSARVG